MPRKSTPGKNGDVMSDVQKNESPSILVADDDEQILRSMVRMLSTKYKTNILSTKNTRDTIAVMQSRLPDLVLLDVHFEEEEQNGIDCVRQARAAGYQGVICMMTADLNPTVLLQAGLAGANDYLIKGSSCDLLAEVDRLLHLTTDDYLAEECRDPITETAFLRSRNLSTKQIALLSEFAAYGYPRIKEFANQLQISETCLWKRLSRIREKLGVDAMTQITHLLTAIKVYERTWKPDRKQHETNESP